MDAIMQLELKLEELFSQVKELEKENSLLKAEIHDLELVQKNKDSRIESLLEKVQEK